MQSLKDYLYVKSSYFDIRVPVHIYPVDCSKPSTARAPCLFSPQIPKPMNLDNEAPLTERIKIQLPFTTELKEDLEKIRIEIDKKQQDLQEEKAKLHESYLSTETNEVEDTLEQIKALLREKEPNLEKLVTISLAQERQKHERQNAKVLQILQTKDLEISEIKQQMITIELMNEKVVEEGELVQAKFSELSQDYEKVVKNEELLKKNMMDYEVIIRQVSSDNEKLKNQLATMIDLKRHTDLEEEFKALAEKSQADNKTIESLNAELRELKNKAEEIEQKEACVLELANRQEETKRQHIEELNKLIQERDTALTNLEEVQTKVEQLEDLLQNETNTKQLILSQVLKKSEELENEFINLENEYKSNNDKMLNILKFEDNDCLVNSEDYREVSKNCIMELKVMVESMKRRIGELESSKEVLESRLKVAEDTSSIYQSDKALLIKRYSEEILCLQNKVVKLEEKSNKINSEIEIQTILTSNNISDLTQILKDYKEKVEIAAQEKEEHKNYISKLETEINNKEQEVTRLKADLEAIITKYEYNTNKDRGEEAEIISKLNSKVSALQIQLHQLKTKVPEGDKSLTEHVTDRMNNFEVTIVQLREEIIRSEGEKCRIEKAAKLEKDTLSAKVKALEQILNSSKDLPLIENKLELVKLKELNTVLEDNMRVLKEELIKSKEEISRLKQSDKLSNTLSSDKDLTLKLTNKVKTQRKELTKLKNLLIKAKVEFDEVKKKTESFIPVKENLNEFDWENFHNERYKQQVNEHCKQAREYKNKLKDSLRVILQLKEESINKIIEQKDIYEKQLYKVAEDARTYQRESLTLIQQVEKLKGKLQVEQSHFNELEVKKNIMQEELKQQVKQYEKELSEERCKNEKMKGQVKKCEGVIQERATQISLLMETVEALQKKNSDVIEQKLMNCTSELYSVRSLYENMERKVQEQEFIIKDFKRTINNYTNLEKNLLNENKKLTQELNTLKKTIEFQTAEIERLETDLNNNRAHLVNETVKVKTLEEQLKVKAKRIDVLKLQLNESQNNICYSNPIEQFKERKHTQSLVYELKGNLKGDGVIQKMSKIILESDKKIQDLEEINTELECKLAQTQLRRHEELTYDKLLRMYSAIANENNQLLLLLESMFNFHEQVQVEIELNKNNLRTELEYSIYKANKKILELAADNNNLKAELKEIQGKLEEEARCIQITKVKQEVNIESFDLIKDINIDTKVLESMLSDNTQSLAKEVVAQKLLIEKLQNAINSLTNKKSELEKQVDELLILLKNQNEELNKLNAECCLKYKKKAEIYNDSIIEVSQYMIDKKNNEAIHMQNTIKLLKEENNKLRLQIKEHNIKTNLLTTHEQVIGELKVGIQNEIERSNKEVNELKERIIIMQSKHNTEIKKLQLAQSKKSHNSPERINMENKSLMNNCISLEKTVESLQLQIVSLNERIRIMNENIQDAHNEIECYKKALVDIEKIPEIINERLSISISSNKPKRNLTERKGKKSIQIITPQVKDEFFKLPKLIKEILNAKQLEANAEAHVRKLAKELLEDKKELSKHKMQIKDLEAALSNYEQLLRENGITKTEERKDELIQLKRRIVELETTYEEYRNKELIQLSNYNNIKQEETYKEEGNENTLSLLINGVIVLCNKLTLIGSEYNNKGLDSLERVQRIAIKGLVSLVQRLKGDINIQCQVPSNEKDKQVWYLELAELQTQYVENAVSKLKEYTGKVAIEITGSFSSAAQMKALAIELANQTKEVIEEVEKLKYACHLARKDIEQSFNIIAGESPKENIVLKCVDHIKIDDKQNVSKDNETLKYANDQLKEELDREKKNVLSLRSEMEECKKEIEDYKENKITNCIKQINEQESIITALNKEKQELLSKHTEQSKAKKFLEEELEEEKEEKSKLSERLKKEIEERERNIEAWNKERDEMGVIINSLKADAERLNLQSKHLSEYKKEDIKLKDKLEEKISLLNLDIETLAKKLNAAELTIQDYNQKISLLLKEIQVKSQRIEELHKSNTELIEEIEKQEEKSMQQRKELEDELNMRIEEYERKLEQQSVNEQAIINQRNIDINLLVQRNKELDNNLKKKTEELNDAHTYTLNLENALRKTEPQASENANNLKQEDYRKIIEELREEYNDFKVSSEKLITMYELQLKILEGKFRENYAELNGKLTEKLKNMVDLKKEDFVSYIVKVTQKDAQIEMLEKECAAANIKLNKFNLKLSKLKVKQKKKPKPNTSLSPVKDTNDKTYNNLLKEKTKLEIQVGKAQTRIKELEYKLQLSIDENKELIHKIEKNKEYEDINAALIKLKKEHIEAKDNYKRERQEALEEIAKLKINSDAFIEFKRNSDFQVKSLKEELNRAREQLKEAAANEEIVLKKCNKELVRKDQAIKSLKMNIEGARLAEKQLVEESKILNEKVKILKAETSRKDVVLKAFKEKSEEAKTDRSTSKDEEVDKLKKKLTTAKQDVERKEDQIRVYKSKIESLAQELNTIKSVLESKEEVKTVEAKELKRILKVIFEDLLVDIEKLRIKVNIKEHDTQIYKESFDILGVQEEDIKDFVPTQNPDAFINTKAKIKKLIEKANTYESILKEYKNLTQEKRELENSISGIEVTPR